jgi:hypothetical protein
MPTFLDFHPTGKYTEDDLKKGQKEPRDEFGVKALNTLYDPDSGTMFCLLDAPDRYCSGKTLFQVWDKMQVDY